MNKKYLIVLSVVVLTAAGSVAYFKYYAKKQNVVIEGPDMESMLKGRAEEELRKKMYAPFIEVYKNMLAKSPNDPNIKRKLAEAYVGAGQNMEASQLLEELLKSNPDDQGLKNLLDKVR